MLCGVLCGFGELLGGGRDASGKEGQLFLTCDFAEVDDRMSPQAMSL